jgi:hypothetical protein
LRREPDELLLPSNVGASGGRAALQRSVHAYLWIVITNRLQSVRDLLSQTPAKKLI